MQIEKQIKSKMPYTDVDDTDYIEYDKSPKQIIKHNHQNNGSNSKHMSIQYKLNL